jgi:hypothetical protein
MKQKTPPDIIPWQAAKAWAEQWDMEKVIILCGRDSEPPTQNVLTYGKTPAQSAEAAQYGNWIKDQVWPANKPHDDKPAWLVGLTNVYWKVKRYLYHNASYSELDAVVKENREAIESKIGK